MASITQFSSWQTCWIPSCESSFNSSIWLISSGDLPSKICVMMCSLSSLVGRVLFLTCFSAFFALSFFCGFAFLSFSCHAFTASSHTLSARSATISCTLCPSANLRFTSSLLALTGSTNFPTLAITATALYIPFICCLSGFLIPLAKSSCLAISVYGIPFATRLSLW